MGRAEPGGTHWTVVALVIAAIGGLFFGGWQSCTAHEHFAVSIQPRLTSDPAVSRESEATLVSLENVGLGPAIVVWTQLRVKGRIPGPDRFSGWMDFVDEARRIELPPGLKPTHYSAQDALRPQYRGTLVGWNRVIGDDCQRERFRELLKESEYRVCYESLNGRRWTFMARLYGPRKTIEGCEENAGESFARHPELQRVPPEISDHCRGESPPRPS